MCADGGSVQRKNSKRTDQYNKSASYHKTSSFKNFDEEKYEWSYYQLDSIDEHSIEVEVKTKLVDYVVWDEVYHTARDKHD